MLNTIAGVLGAPVPIVLTADFESIQTVTVPGGGQASISFTSIPATYSHLQIRAITQVNPAGNPIVRFNSDTAANYTFHQLVGDASAASSSGGGSQTFIYQPYALNTNWMSMIIDVYDYANTSKFKTIKTMGGHDNNGSGYSPVEFMSGLWRSTSAITNILISGNGSTLNQYSTFALYGIK